MSTATRAPVFHPVDRVPCAESWLKGWRTEAMRNPGARMPERPPVLNTVDRTVDPGAARACGRNTDTGETRAEQAGLDSPANPARVSASTTKGPLGDPRVPARASPPLKFGPNVGQWV